MSFKPARVVLLFAALAGCTTALDEAGNDVVVDPAAVVDQGVIVGEIDWVSSTQLTGTAKTASLATGYVSIPQARARCSGFLIGRDVFMTNHHCISNAAMAFGVTVNFKYDTVWDHSGVVRCDEFIGADQTLDYALVRCAGNPGDTYGWLTLDPHTLSTTDSIQLFHQQCDYTTDASCAPTKKMSPGRITSTTARPNRVTHDADMLGGSSGGAIVAANTTNVVAINSAHVLTGTTNGRGTTNIGVPMSLVVAHLRANFPSVLSSSPTSTTPAAPACAVVPADGRVIDEDDGCVTLLGDAQWWRAVDGAGSGDDLVWTGTTASAVGKNVANVAVAVAASGRYAVSAFVDVRYATAENARYVISHDEGVTEVVFDQGAVTSSGWVSLGAFTFTVGRTGRVQLADNTGVASQQLVVDAIAVVPATTTTEPGTGAVDACSLVRIDGVQALNVRAEPNTNNDPIAVLGVNDVAERTGSVEGQRVNGSTTWYAITTAGGVQGYIAAAYAACVN
jgi:V8-like Glu-specific endopeptidase